MPAILERQDVVLAAETGSGKTLAYLAPLLQQVLAQRQQAQQQAQQQQAAHQLHQPRQLYTAALVLCPNVMLCEQVRRLPLYLWVQGKAARHFHGRACGLRPATAQKPEHLPLHP